MLSRKQRWRRTRVRRSSKLSNAGRAFSKRKEDSGGFCSLIGQAAAKADEEDSDQTTLSAWSSFDSLHVNDDDAGMASPPSPPAPTPERSVSFQEEVQVYLVIHKSEIDFSSKQALWWTRRDAAMNKRAWLNHLGQPGCGRESARRPQEHQQHQHEHHSANFHGVGRSRGVSAKGFGYDGAMERPAPGWQQAGGVGILGCLCSDCMMEGETDERDEDHEAQQREYVARLSPLRYQQHRHQKHQHLPRPYNNAPPSPYSSSYGSHAPPSPYDAVGFCGAPCKVAGACGHDQYNYMPPSPITNPGSWGGGSARRPSVSWFLPEDWDTEDDLGGKGSRSYSPDLSEGASPLYEACQSYDDEEGGFPSGSYFFRR